VLGLLSIAQENRRMFNAYRLQTIHVSAAFLLCASACGDDAGGTGKSVERHCLSFSSGDAPDIADRSVAVKSTIAGGHVTLSGVDLGVSGCTDVTLTGTITNTVSNGSVSVDEFVLDAFKCGGYSGDGTGEHGAGDTNFEVELTRSADSIVCTFVAPS